MTEPGQNPENLEPIPSGSTETDANASDANGTAPSSESGTDESQQATAAGESAQPEEAPAASTDDSTETAATETPVTETSAEAPATETPAAAPAAETEAPVEEASAVASESASSDTAVSEATTAAETSGEVTPEGEEGASSDEDSGSQRRGPRGWQPPAMTEERMKEIWDELAARKQAHEEIELEVVSQNRGGVVTQYKGVEVFVPMSHWTLDRHGTDPGDDAVNGNRVTAHVLEMTEFATDARRVTATRRSVLRKSVLEALEVGMKVAGRVSSILDFGIFVDLGGIDGLVHASEISHVRGRHPSELVKKGEEVEVVIKEIDREKERIYLGMKELLPSPWSNVEEKFPEGTMQNGKVVGMTKQGAFVELEPGLDGFIRLRELSWTKRVHHPKEVLRKGMDIDVKVLEVNERKQRLSLSYRQAHEDPWPSISEKYNVGTQWEGEIREISNKGVVVGVDEVEGFLPRGRMGRESKRLPEMKVGEKLTVNVIEVDPKNFSLIFGLPHPDRGEDEGRGRGRGDRRDDRGRQQAAPAPPKNELKSAETVTNFALGDMIGEELKKRLGMESDEPQPEEKQASTPHNVPSGDTASTTAPAENQTPPANVEQATEQAEQAREHQSSEEAAARADQLEQQAESAEEGASVEVSSADGGSEGDDGENSGSSV